jgi:predicted dehydrogenase
MNNIPIRFGILGSGWILRKYAEATRLAQGVELVAVASRDLTRAQAVAAQHGLPRAHGSYGALLADDGVDAVINALHNGLHCEWTCRALAAGKHVLCEKPLACSSAEVDQMFGAAHRHRRWLMEGFMYRFHPQMALVRDRLPALGRILHVNSRRMSQGREAGNPRYDSAQGGGALMDIGCYCVDFARWIFGTEPVRVDASAHLGPTGVDLTLTGTFVFADAGTAQFCCSFESEPSYGAEIVGTAGRILIPHPWMPPTWPTEFQVVHANQVETVRVQPATGPQHVLTPFALELEHFADCIRTGQPPAVITEADSRANMRLIEALRAAAAAR